MFSGFVKTVGLIAAALAIMTTPAAAATTAPAPMPVHRIIAVGDLHGDFAAWRAIARAAGLVNPQGHWTGGAAVLVQVGDAVDRGPASLQIITDLMRLQREAPRAGGRVVALVGNHEAMNVTDDLRYVSEGDYTAFTNAQSTALREEVYAQNRAQIEAAYRARDPSLTSPAVKQAWLAATPLGQIEHQRAWHPEGWVGRWVIHNPAVVLIDDTLFVHGGISAAYDRLSIEQINRAVADALSARATDPTAIINDPSGPLWYRGLTRPTDSAPSGVGSAPSPEIELDQVLNAYGAKRMVIAHTPLLSGIAMLYDGKLIRIDTGISAYYGGKLSYLEIFDGAPSAHEVARPASSH